MGLAHLECIRGASPPTSALLGLPFLLYSQESRMELAWKFGFILLSMTLLEREAFGPFEVRLEQRVLAFPSGGHGIERL